MNDTDQDNDMSDVKIGDRLQVISGHLRTHYGTITEPDNGDGHGVAIDGALVFLRFKADEIKILRTRHELWLAGRSQPAQ